MVASRYLNIFLLLPCCPFVLRLNLCLSASNISERGVLSLDTVHLLFYLCDCFNSLTRLFKTGIMSCSLLYSDSSYFSACQVPNIQYLCARLLRRTSFFLQLAVFAELKFFRGWFSPPLFSPDLKKKKKPFTAVKNWASEDGNQRQLRRN